MSEHHWVQDNLDAYVTGALSAPERSRLERHLEACEECAHAKAEISEMELLLEGVFARVRPDAGLEDRAIHQLRRARKPRPSWLRFVSAAAAVIFLGMIGAGVQLFALDGSLPFADNQVKKEKEIAQGRPWAVNLSSGRSQPSEEMQPPEMPLDGYFRQGKSLKGW